MDPTTEYLSDYACRLAYGDLSPEAVHHRVEGFVWAGRQSLECHLTAKNPKRSVLLDHLSLARLLLLQLGRGSLSIIGKSQP
jgi:hypothetical protein